MIIRRGLVIAIVGVALGLLGALVASRFVSAMLCDVSPTDMTTSGAVTMLLLGVAAFASAIPARSTARIDPILALRGE